MKPQSFLLIIISLLVAGAIPVVLTGCSGTSGQEQAAKYHCPMHPTVISDQPGSCNICGMDLVAIGQDEEDFEEEVTDHSKHEGSDHKRSETKSEKASHEGHFPEGYTTVKIHPEKQQLIGVKTANVEKEALIHRVRVVGEVAHDPDMYQAQVEYLKTRNYGKALREASRVKLEHLGMSSIQIRELEKRNKAKRNLIVSEKDPVFWVYAYFYEADLPKIKQGQRVIVTIPTLDDVFVGQLKALRAHIDSATRSVRGIVEIEDPTFKLRPGLFVNVDVTINLKESMVVPTSSVIDTGERQLVFVKKGKGTFEPRLVKLGIVSGEQVQVVKGVDPGEEVVVGANFMIDSESKLRAVIEQGGSSGGGHQH